MNKQQLGRNIRLLWWRSVALNAQIPLGELVVWTGSGEDGALSWVPLDWGDWGGVVLEDAHWFSFLERWEQYIFKLNDSNRWKSEKDFTE